MRNHIAILVLILPLVAFGENSMQNNANEISKHYSAQPSLYQFDNISKEKLSDNITRQYM